jgi:uncharacterized protein (DUF927 family)
MQRMKDNSAGMALVEAAVAVLVLAVIVAGSIYVINHRPADASTTASTTTTNTTSSQPGTTASIDQLTQNDAQSEQQSATAGDAQTQQDALSANSAASNVGGAYDESTF